MMVIYPLTDLSATCREGGVGAHHAWALGIAAALLLSSAGTATGQSHPGKPFIDAAAQQLNAITPQAVPQQTIRVGHYDGATNRFTFVLPPSYPDNVPAYKRAENGGPVQPSYVANINSYNVKYEFVIANKPAEFGIKVSFPEPDGRVVEKTAAANATLATVAFNPRSFRRQTVVIQRPGRDTTVHITPHLREQLGGFVVPHLLVGIVYEPPGPGSTAEYAQTKTATTEVTWGFSRTSGLVETIDPNAMYDLFIQGMGGGVGVVEGLDSKNTGAGGPGLPYGEIMKVIADLREKTSVTSTVDTTTGTSTTEGRGISITVAFDTKLHRYPGGGDLFIIMHDVLFVYVASDGKVVLAPMAYSGVIAQTAAELRGEVPPVVVVPRDLAEEIIALNPHFSGGLPGQSRRAARGLAAAVARRFEPWPEKRLCNESGGEFLTLEEEHFRAETASQTRSQTWIEHTGGLVASIQGGGDKLSGVTYSTASEQSTGHSQTTSIYLHCDGNDQFWVDVYLDNLFRSFLSVRAEPAASSAAIAGTVNGPRGQPVPGQPVTLVAGGERYTVLTDANGRFSFPIAALPRGAASLVVGRSESRITYRGSPLTNLKVPLGGQRIRPRIPR